MRLSLSSQPCVVSAAKRLLLRVPRSGRALCFTHPSLGFARLPPLSAGQDSCSSAPQTLRERFPTCQRLSAADSALPHRSGHSSPSRPIRCDQRNPQVKGEAAGNNCGPNIWGITALTNPPPSAAGSERSGGQASQREKTEEYTLTPILYSRPAHISAARGFGYEELVKTGDGGERWKPGLFADSPGSFVDLSYHPPKTHLRPGTSACLTFIISHSRMGVAYLSCKGACQCKVMRINAFDAGAHTVERTECHTLMMEATEAGSNGAAAPPPAQNCTLHVEVTGKTSTGSHHFKITSLSFHNAQTVECRHGIC